MVQAATTSPTTGTMQYTICPCSSDVCRIRFDLTVNISIIGFKQFFNHFNTFTSYFSYDIQLIIYLQSFMLSGPYLPATPNAGAESDDGKFLILSIFQNELSLIVK